MMESRFINRHSEFISEYFSSVQDILKQVQDDKLFNVIPAKAGIQKTTGCPLSTCGHDRQETSINRI